jgi:hypothetical protein
MLSSRYAFGGETVRDPIGVYWQKLHTRFRSCLRCAYKATSYFALRGRGGG